MSTINVKIKRAVVAAVLSGGMAATGFGLSAGTAQAAPTVPAPQHWGYEYCSWAWWDWDHCHDFYYWHDWDYKHDGHHDDHDHDQH